MAQVPDQQLQLEAARAAQEIRAKGGGRKGRDQADAWVIATARIHGLTVVSYEGRDFTGPTRKWADKMPGICGMLQVRHCTLPYSFIQLGMRF